MIPFDFTYCRTETLQEAREVYMKFHSRQKDPVYYAGGSEIITMSRAGAITPGAVIDIKTIPECKQLSVDEEGLHIGSACTLNDIKESNHFPLLTLACGRISDHTNQCRITLGGNLCGTIRYRETSLPLLLADASITLFGGNGLLTLPFAKVFSGKMNLSPGELVVTLHIPAWALQARHFHVKQTTNEKMDYPLVSMAALVKDGYLRTAFSGICFHPFQSAGMDAIFNNKTLSIEERVRQAVTQLPETAYQDVEGSDAYRLFVFKNIVQALLKETVND